MTLPTLTLTTEFEFDYAHFLPYHPGKCKNLHGHHGVMLLEFKRKLGSGITNSEGMIVDFGDIKSFVKETIIKELDHSYLNDLIDNPTCENLCLWIVNLFETPIFKNAFNEYKVEPVSITIYETPKNYVTYKFMG